jgi:pantoate kinase
MRAKAFCPAGISSFFEICDRTSDGALIKDPLHVGARGGGFVIDKGILTEVKVVESHENHVRIFINEKPAPEAETTKAVAETLLEKTSKCFDVTVRHSVEVPIGAGFGSSAAGALSTALALSRALGINLTCNQLGQIAHVAEVKCRTGLGTVGPIMLGGCIITVEPGAPGYALIDRIPVPSNYRIVAGVCQPIPTKEILSSMEKRAIINDWGRRTLNRILTDPFPENFMLASKEFAVKTGLLSNNVQELIEAAEKAGAIGAAQNMVGEAVHALVEADKVNSVVKAFEEILPHEKVLVAKIDLQGARLVR